MNGYWCLLILKFWEKSHLTFIGCVSLLWVHEHLIENENIMKSAFCFDFSEAALYTETLRPTPSLWGTRILLCLQGFPQVMPLALSILYAVSYSQLSDFRFGMGETTETKNSWLPAHGKLLVDVSPLVFQPNLWPSGLPAKLVSFLSQKTQVIFREDVEAWFG